MKIKSIYPRASSPTSSLTLLLILAISFATLFLPLTSLRAATLTDGMNATYVIGDGSGSQDFTSREPGTSASTFRTGPKGIHLDATNNRLFVADSGNHRVLIFNVDPTTKLPVDYTADNVLGQADFTSGSLNRGGSPASTTVASPVGLAYDSTNQFLFISEGGNNRVIVYDVNSITDGEGALYVYGQADFTSISSNRGGSIAATGLSAVDDIEFDNTNDRLFVSDRANNRVLVWDTSDIATGDNGAADNVLGQANFTSGSANRGGTLTQNTLSNPGGLEWDSVNDYLYVGESSNFAASNERVLVFDVGTIADGENAINVLGQEDFTTDGTTLDQDGIGAIIGDIELDETNNRLFVSDPFQQRVMVWDVATIADGEDAANVLGQADFTSNPYLTGTSTQAYFNGPSHLSYDSSTSLLYLSDSTNNRVLIFDLSAAVVSSSTNGWSYIHPPLCEAIISPSTITKGEQATLSWKTTWPTEKKGTYYAKVPGPDGGLFSHKVSSIKMTPQHTQSITMFTFNLWGANPCTAEIEVLDENGQELTSKNNSYLTAGASNSPFVKAISNFFRSIVGK